RCRGSRWTWRSAPPTCPGGSTPRACRSGRGEGRGSGGADVGDGNRDVARFDGPKPDGSVPPPIRPRPPDPGDRHRGATWPASVPDWAAGRPDPAPDGCAAASAPSGNRQPPGQSWRAGKGDRSALLFVQESDPPTECIPKGAPRIGKLPLCGLAGV